MSSIMDTLFGRKQTPTETFLPLDPGEAETVLEGLDGTTDRILLALETGKSEVWTRMLNEQQPSLIINDKETTKIGPYDVPGRYKFVEYQ